MKKFLLRDKNYINLVLYFTDKSDKAEAKEILYGVVREDISSTLRASYLTEINDCLANKVHNIRISCDKKCTYAQIEFYFESRKKPYVRSMLSSFDFDYIKFMMKNKQLIKESA